MRTRNAERDSSERDVISKQLHLDASGAPVGERHEQNARPRESPEADRGQRVHTTLRRLKLQIRLNLEFGQSFGYFCDRRPPNHSEKRAWRVAYRPVKKDAFTYLSEKERRARRAESRRGLFRVLLFSDETGAMSTRSVLFPGTTLRSLFARAL